METNSLELSSAPLIKAKLLQLSRLVESGLIKHGFLKPAEGRTPELSAVANLSEERTLELIKDLELSAQELSTVSELITPESRRRADLEQFMRFLVKNRYHLKDESIYDVIEAGDVLEVYDSRLIQIWRNWEFYRVCAYSLLELLANDWNTLFIRPSWVVDKLMAMVPLMFTENAKTRAYDIPEYVMRARKFPDTHGMLFKMKYVSTIYNHVGQPVAILTTGSLRVLPEKDLAQRLDFI